MNEPKRVHALFERASENIAVEADHYFDITASDDNVVQIDNSHGANFPLLRFQKRPFWCNSTYCLLELEKPPVLGISPEPAAVLIQDPLDHHTSNRVTPLG